MHDARVAKLANFRDASNPPALARILKTKSAAPGWRRTPMIVSTMRVVTSPANRADVVQALRTMSGPLEVRPGCLGCRLYCDVQDAAVLTWIEEWESREALDEHLRSAEYRRILAILEMSTSPPLLRFDTVSGSAGLEIVEMARQRGAFEMT